MKPFILTFINTILFSFTVSAQGSFPYSATLTDIQGNEINSNTFTNQGKPLIIDFWGAFCKPCIVKYHSMAEVYKQWQKDTRVKIIIISIDHEKMQSKSKEMIEKYDWPFEAYFDPNQELLEQLSSTSSVPQTFIYDGDFNLIKKKKGARIIPKDPSVDQSKIMEIMHESGSLESLTCDLTEYREAVKLAAKEE
ncbi:redoxin domain-containing protein [Ekhidna sp.]|uniref:peroxiredoxin family protein n=1 Tax=Ekhidna sp. TaxID=2608089 RepID=UPI003B5B3C44